MPSSRDLYTSKPQCVYRILVISHAIAVTNCDRGPCNYLKVNVNPAVSWRVFISDPLFKMVAHNCRKGFLKCGCHILS